ncbi:putative polysaccharide biosynthesis protein [Caldisalinibacter kiritimatiensis]|uniref:Stage V sporulation protein B n=1 Tax=Caldisalinibacter kiritimatiensis TaxID=1304284 RepID=R1AUM6_9FIRM|nr:polysaccharide biosynthesis protein [Caldisalinibacter kiritimatiensis]EOD00347.1 Stage V sporulation protein B [Caldisalinibacter kiritimatiensis]
MTKENFLKGAAILGIAGVIVKILGAVYRIPLANLITAEGMGYYQPSYQMYAFLLAISTAGFPTAIAKLVSEKRALGNYRGAHKVFRVSLLAMLMVGILTSSFVYFTAESIVKLIGNTNSYYSLVALIPALFFVPIMSAFRGYFQGRQTMTPTALSQVIEQLFRVIFGLYLAYTLLEKGLPIAASGASFGASAGAIFGTIGILIIYFIRKRNIRIEIKSSSEEELESTNTIVKRLLSIAIPIAIGAAIVPIMNTIDAGIVMRRLQFIDYSEVEAAELYGQLGGMAQTLINFPQVFSLALAMSLVPAVSDAFARKNYQNIKRITRSGVRVTLLIGLPAALGLYILSTPIIKLLYFNNDLSTLESTGAILEILAFSVLFLTLIQSLTAILQGLGKPRVPVRNLAVGAVFKIVLTYILTGIPEINIKGAAISTVVAYFIACILNFIAVEKHTKTKFNFINTFIKPIISVTIMVLTTWFTYQYTMSLIGAKLATILAIFVGAIVYGSALLITGAITSRDFDLLPFGNKIARLLKAIGLLRG